MRVYSGLLYVAVRVSPSSNLHINTLSSFFSFLHNLYLSSQKISSLACHAVISLLWQHRGKSKGVDGQGNPWHHSTGSMEFCLQTALKKMNCSHRRNGQRRSGKLQKSYYAVSSQSGMGSCYADLSGHKSVRYHCNSFQQQAKPSFLQDPLSIQHQGREKRQRQSMCVL